MAGNAQIQSKIDDALKRLVRILARQAAHDVFEQQSHENIDEKRTDRPTPACDEKQS